MINKLDLFKEPHFKALGIYLIFGTKFSWNEGIDTCFNVECVLLGRNFDFLGGYCLLLVVTWWLLVATARYRSLLLVPTFSMNGKKLIIFHRTTVNKDTIKFKVLNLCFSATTKKTISVYFQMKLQKMMREKYRLKCC